MKRIAVITGASSGMGRRFAQTIGEIGQLDELWVIARRQERLEELRGEVPCALRPIALDLSQRESYGKYAELLAAEQPDVVLLINASGYGFFCATEDKGTAENLNMLDLNCAAVMAMCQNTLPYMHKGAKILNIASVAAFQPVPYINVYAATKAFVLHYSRALNREVKGRGISVTALCPYWTKTEFFDRAVDSGEEPVVKKYIAMYEPEDLVRRGWRDLKRGKDLSKFGFIARTQAVLAKLLPHKLVMDVWMQQQKLK